MDQDFEKKCLVNEVKSASKFFELDITIKIFGVQVFHWHFPPSKNSLL